MEAVFRVDGTPRVGGGHIQRCLVIADYLRNAGWNCRFLSAAGSKETVPALGASNHAVEEFELSPGEEPKRALLDRVGSPDLLVLDHYEIDKDAETVYGKQAKKIVVIDDLANRRHICDSLIDTGPGRDQKHYKHLVPAHTQLFTGTGYALLRPEFFIQRTTRFARRSRRANETPEILFVCFGAVDVLDMNSKVIDAIEADPLDMEIHFVLGPMSHNLNKVKSRLDSMHADVHLHIGPTDLIRLMANSNLVIGAGGTMALECCCLGLPSVVVTVAENQEPGVRYLAEQNAVVHVGSAQDVRPPDITGMIKSLISDRRRRERLEGNSLQICDGLGGPRIALSLDSQCRRDQATISLRSADAADIDRLYEWQNEPGARQYFRNPAVPEWDEHREWFSQTLYCPGSSLNIIERHGGPVGYVRLDCLSEPETFEVSILVCAAAAHQGIGREALRQVRHLLPTAKLKASVAIDNIASQRLFAKAGYQPEGEWLVSKASSAADRMRIDA